MADEKSPGLAAALNLIFAGIGQFYAGAPIRGVCWVVADAFSAWLLFGSFAVSDNGRTVLINWGYVVFTLLVTVVSMVDAYAAAVSYNAKHIQPCPRCGAKNTRGQSFCLICNAPMSGAAPMPGPQPPPPYAPPPPYR